MTDISVLIIIIVILFIAFILKAVKVVPEGYEWIVEYFGKPKKETLKPGTHFIMPFISKIRAKVSMKEQDMHVPPQGVITTDEVTVIIDSIAFYKIINPLKAVYCEEDIRRKIAYEIQLNIRKVACEMNVDEVLKSRVYMNQEVCKNAYEALEALGVELIRVEIKEIRIPQEIEELYKNKHNLENQRTIINNILGDIEEKLDNKNISNNKSWCNQLKDSLEQKNIDTIIELFDKNVEYYKNSTTRLYNTSEIEEDWKELLEEDYPRIDMNIEMQEGDCFILSIKVNIYSIIAKIKLNAEGKCTYFKKWQEN